LPDLTYIFDQIEIEKIFGNYSDTLRTAWATARDRRSEVPAHLVPIHLGQAQGTAPTIPK